MTQDASSFKVELPSALKPWAAHHAKRIGLPSPENYILLIARRAWQDDYLKALQEGCHLNRRLHDF